MNRCIKLHMYAQNATSRKHDAQTKRDVNRRHNNSETRYSRAGCWEAEDVVEMPNFESLL